MSSDASTAQPKRGLAGLLFVLPVAGLLAAGAGGPAHSAALLGPVVTFALPLVAMIAFWWEDWPGTLARGGWSGLSDTAIVVAGGLLLAAVGRAIGGTGAIALAAGIFTAMLQLTLVCERWPLDGFGRIRSGIAALLLCWVAGVAGYLLAARVLEEYGAWLTAVGVWQMIFYVALRGWPFTRIGARAVRLVSANAAVVACGWGTYAIGRLAGWAPGRITAVCGAGIAAVLVVSMLFEAWPAIRLGLLPGRGLALLITLLLTAVLSWTLPMLARRTGVPGTEVNGWVAHATLNALSLAVILHVAVWRRWPVRSG
ncbi:MAG TPA: hypothetical protein VJX66_20285 [Amycolatopsis sp.]|nr:hypothetical protein [Amycolatopsis sp.]